jgi:hypothetical protein
MSASVRSLNYKNGESGMPEKTHAISIVPRNTYRRVGYFEGFDDVGLTSIITDAKPQEIILL